MMVRHVLQISIPVLLLLLVVVGVCPAHSVPSAGAREAGEVPPSQLRMLSRGLAHLLQGVKENTEQLELQVEQTMAQLDEATQSLESLKKQIVQTGESHIQGRKELQSLSARGDGLWRTVKDLQVELEDVETEQRTTQHQVDRILQTLRSLAEQRSKGQTPLHTGSVKVMVNKQARRLSGLTSLVSAQDKLINRRLQRLEHLEKHVRNLRWSDGVPASPRSQPDSGFVRRAQLHQH